MLPNAQNRVSFNCSESSPLDHNFSSHLRNVLKPGAQKEKLGERSRRQQARVLVIADEPDVSYRPSLENAGLEVVGVAGGPAALISLHRYRPQLVIASFEIKGLSINDLARTLAGTEDGLLPMIVVGSEPSTLERRQAAISAGAFDYFQIPAEVGLLVLRANQLVRVRQSFDRLRAEADIDHLTGLANRRRFRAALARELERWRRYGAPCALLLLDIDFMKSINDEYGHPFGDLVISHIANKLSQVSRDTDTAARLGGEEFALLLAGIDADKAELAARRLLGILSEESIEGVRNVTVSIGLAACPAHADSERSLYAASDAALYVAKNEGRNRVAVAPLLQQTLPGV
jgi:diguanylate cyclase (GGDEF)-like protein